MCGVMLSIIIFVLALFQFPLALNSFTRFPSCANLILGTISYCSSSSSSSSCLGSLASLLLLLLRCFSISLVHISYSPSFCYIIKKQFHVRSAVFLQVRLLLPTQVLIRRFIILKLCF